MRRRVVRRAPKKAKVTAVKLKAPSAMAEWQKHLAILKQTAIEKGRALDRAGTNWLVAEHEVDVFRRAKRKYGIR
jgi:hypothetical protein